MCTDTSCGAPKGRGRPKTGWNKVEGDFGLGHGREPRWYCSWRCLSTAALAEAEKESGAGDAAPLFE